ncbi:MAG: hypothetical protein Tsb0020_34180 [Haliangiales bacterium]
MIICVYTEIAPQLAPLLDLLTGRRVVALTGAGCSTESGIPDYRGPETRRRARNPIQFRAFVGDPESRSRYWARSFVGWPKLHQARPNPAHEALEALERAGHLAGLITQNVDRLHHAAGSRRVVELHGALTEVRCLDCGVLEDRSALQRRLAKLNPGFAPSARELAPDGDAELARAGAWRDFAVPTCLACGGVLKPNVVFFGEHVPRAVVDDAWALFAQADALLVVGSSLAVFSGYRFVRRAAQDKLPIAIVNLGPTRGDEYAAVRVDAHAGTALPALTRALTASVRAPLP